MFENIKWKRVGGILVATVSGALITTNIFISFVLLILVLFLIDFKEAN